MDGLKKSNQHSELYLVTIKKQDKMIQFLVDLGLETRQNNMEGSAIFYIRKGL